MRKAYKSSSDGVFPKWHNVTSSYGNYQLQLVLLFRFTPQTYSLGKQQTMLLHFSIGNLNV